MRTSSNASLAAAVIAAAAAAALAQERPESILPPGFGDTAPAPAPATPRPATPGRVPVPATPETTPTPAAGGVIQPLPSGTPSATPTATPTPTPTPIDPATLARYEMPEFARRSLNAVGVSAEVGPAAFAGADGGFVQALMRRTAAPLPSRWLSIALRRALSSRLEPPDGVDGADFAAERAWLLLRMGESVAARAVVQGVDNADYTPKLYQVAMNAMLATGDPAGLCPLADAGRAATGERGWAFAQPICAALAGNGTAARAQFTALRRRRLATGVDLLLAEKVVGAGSQGRQAVTIEWDGVDRLTTWRFGLAAATGTTIPEALFAGVGAQVMSWRALAPGIPLAQRVEAAEVAAGQGVFSNTALVDLYGAVAADDDAPSGPTATATDLRTAYAGVDSATRMAALRQLWRARPSYARLVLTARAAVRQPASGDNTDANRIVASLLSAGLDRTAARWSGAVAAGGDGWAMLALADPDRRQFVSYAQLQGYDGGSEIKRRLLFAGLAGLGRLSAEDIERAAEALDVRIGAANSWTRALDRAAADGQAGSVLLLAAIGMQTGSWRGVPPEALYRIVTALRAVGLDGEARMIAAEAIARA
ncbi:hypothetical protein [Sphingomonas sp. Leaf343]|uniref:hypothetical protein n=1 Tax=Sphingomonas sp. Leaf343 TaxID=1736345 RepID=UPI0006FB6AB3|nr:hypothetical protein [Sphingomonas sp. Leaf343]KQR84021.1 hypothetical protein ASG07_05275 [Sphingomonas sp. Leaf343]